MGLVIRIILLIVALCAMTGLSYATEEAQGSKLRVELDIPPNAEAGKDKIHLTSKKGVKVVGKWKGTAGEPSFPDIVASIGIETPEGFQLMDSQGKVISSASSASGLEHSVLLPLKGLQQKATLNLKTPSGASVPIHVDAQLVLSEPLLVYSPECKRMGVRVSQREDSPPASTFLFVNCADDEKEISLSVAAPQGFKWTRYLKGTVRSTDGRTISKQFVKQKVLPGKAFYTFVLADSDGANTREFTAMLGEAQSKGSRFSFLTSLGTTWSSFTTTFSNVASNKSITQVGLTAKGQMGFAIFPRRFDVAASVFGTVLPLTRNPSSLPPARWLGFNFRFGLQLPMGARNQHVVSLLPGIYAWSMFVQDNNYGVAGLSGPQLVTAYRYTRSSGAGTGGYLKFAALAAGFSLTSLSNREMAAGIYHEFRLFLPRPWSVAADFSMLSFGISSVTLQLNTASVSLGYSVF